MSSLNTELIALLDAGQRPACAQDRGRLWLSELPSERAQAVPLCAGCPVLAACHAAAEASDERHGVWAGIDRTVSVSTQRRRRAAARVEQVAS